MPTSHILLLPHGTAGSVYPFAWLGKLLRARGHRVTLVAADAYEHAASGAGLEFRGVGNAGLDALLRDPDLWSLQRGPYVSYRNAGLATAACVDAVGDIVAGDGMPHLMLAPMINFGARLLREKHGIPLVTVHLYPLLFASAYEVPWYGPDAPRFRVLPLWLRKMLLRLPIPLDKEALPDVRKCCIAHGVDAPRSLWRQWWHSPDGVLALFPEWFAPPQPDWPHATLQWEFPLEDMAATNPLEPALQRFLDAGAKPVVFTAGTGQLQAASFFANAAELAKRSGCRALFLTRKLAQVPRELPDTIFAADYAPFTTLLPQVRAVVHHGGIGTMSQCLAAGVPQLVVAMSLDQPDNGERVERLGAGVTMNAERFTAAQALPLLERCLHDEGMRRAATACADRMRTRRPTDALVDWLESRRVPGRRGVMPASVQGSAHAPPVYMIPGLGADSRTFRGPWTEIPGCTFADWPEYHGEASVAAVARFVADAWRIPEGAILVATSFGGAVACEIARIRAVRAVILVASSPDGSDFRSARTMRVLTRLVSLPRLQRYLRRRENIWRHRHGRDPTPFTRAVLDSIEMFGVCQPSFYRDMFGALCRWQGFSDSRTRVVRIHGRHDSQVRFPDGADLEIDGGHLISMTHARECVEFIRSGLANDFASPPPGPA